MFTARVPLLLHHSLRGVGLHFRAVLLWYECLAVQISISFLFCELETQSCHSAQVSKLSHPHKSNISHRGGACLREQPCKAGFWGNNAKQGSLSPLAHPTQPPHSLSLEQDKKWVSAAEVAQEARCCSKSSLLPWTTVLVEGLGVQTAKCSLVFNIYLWIHSDCILRKKLDEFVLVHF